MAEFKIPPLSTLVGSNLSNFIRSMRGNTIEVKYYPRILLTAMVIILATPLRIYENIRYKPLLKKFKFEKDPIFIIGHWRSGTTFLHNILCQAPDTGYLTTYFSVFPNYLASKWLFKPFMKAEMPEKRPGDNVKLRPESPQEDEFALGNIIPFIYYNFLLFPKRYKQFYSHYVRFKGNPVVKQTFKKYYRQLIAKALLNSGGSQPILKNPVDSARIPALLEIFPRAKFIYIYRNPFTVYLSTLKFFTQLFPTLWFHEISREEIKRIILKTYIKLYNDYEKEKDLIPEGNLVEVRFEDFEHTPVKELERIYTTLQLNNFDAHKAHFENYLRTIINYKKNKYVISDEDLELVRNSWGFAMEKWSYSEPLNKDSRLESHGAIG